MPRGVALVIALIWLALARQAVIAQPNQPDNMNHPWQIYLERQVDESTSDELIFIDSVTGDEVRVKVTGERYTIVGRSVLFFSPATGRMMLASPDGSVRQHPFLQPGGGTRRVDWLASDDGARIAWTLTEGRSQASLTTITTVANLDGTNPRQVLVDGPREAIRLLPVAFSADNQTLYMDYQPDGIGDFTPLRQYAGLFALDVASSQVTMLPGEPGCYCGAGIGAGWFLRLALTSDLSGFDIKAYNLVTQAEQTIPAVHLRNYTQGGNFVISPDGTRAVYTLAQIQNFGAPDQSVQTVIVLVNLSDMTQNPLTQPQSTFVRPIAWTEDNSAVLVADSAEDGTWKISVMDGKLQKVAGATYLGVMQSAAA